MCTQEAIYIMSSSGWMRWSAVAYIYKHSPLGHWDVFLIGYNLCVGPKIAQVIFCVHFETASVANLAI